MHFFYYYSCRGKFQIHNTKEVVRTLDGIQAHLSTCASAEVHEVVKRLPKTIILDELPRLTIWPSQFMGDQVTEGDIALYFFACDNNRFVRPFFCNQLVVLYFLLICISFYSYMCYKQLVEYMIKNDLALKGNLDEVELLIFPSNSMPKKSQRKKNILLFYFLIYTTLIFHVCN